MTLTTLLISMGFILAGLLLAWKFYKPDHKPPAKPAVANKSAMAQLMDAKSAKGQSLTTGDSGRVSGKKGMLDK